MRCAVFGFDTPNLGDDVQSLASALVVPQVDAYVCREQLDKVSFDEPHHLIMASWFAIKKYHAIPSDNINPYYFSQCIGRKELVNKSWLAEWRKNAPIGCRDKKSLETLQENNIDAYFSGCLTAWMGRFFEKPAKRKGIIFLDVPPEMERLIPEELSRDAIRISNHIGDINPRDQLARFKRVAELYDILREAELVVTRRLHGALPCIGFETPVTVYLHDTPKNRGRFSGHDEYLPIVFHDGQKPLGDKGWMEPIIPSLPSTLEINFKRLCDYFETNPEQKWRSVREFVDELPIFERKPEKASMMSRWT